MSHQTPFSIALPFNHLKWKCPRWDSLRFCSRDFNCIERVLSVTANKIKDLIIRGNIWRANVKELLFYDLYSHTVWLIRCSGSSLEDMMTSKVRNRPGERRVYLRWNLLSRSGTALGSFQIIKFYFSNTKPCPLYIMITWYNIDTMIPAMRV